VSGAAFGTVAGLFSGAVNVSAPPLVIYFMMLELPPLALTQMLNLCFIAGKTIQAATLSLAGPGSLPLLAASLPLTVLAIAALSLGIRLQKRMSPGVYSKILRATLAAFVVLLTGQAAIELAHRLHVVPVHLRAAHGTDGFSAGQSILMQRHVPSPSGAICRYADGLVRAKIDAYGCDERVRRQQS
jgi:hypothetical protein